MDSWPSPPRRATYRLQLHKEFGFEQAAAICDYLAALGVSHLYLSPVLEASPGSNHGYDVVDPGQLSTERGGQEGWDVLVRAATGLGLGRLVDIVPNHMAIGGPGNTWWWDVLEHGASSVYAAYFDVEWHPDAMERDQILLPILGDHYGRELEAGRLALARRGARFVVTYFDHILPVNPRSLDTVLAAAARRLPPGGALSSRSRLEHLATSLGRLPKASSTDTASVAERHRDHAILTAELDELCREDPAVAAALDAHLTALNGSPDALDAVFSRQNFRLAWWRTASEELDYRRFFDINDLVAIRVEEPQVFADSHRLPLAWVAEGDVDGLRIDHVDGLWDPAGYLRRLADAAPGAWLLVEKILERDEQLPAGWPVEGTTGYDWLVAVTDVLIDPGGLAALEAGYRAFVGDDTPYPEARRAAKRTVLHGSLATDINRLVQRLMGICREHRRYRDYTRRDLHDTLVEVVMGFGVYRTYVEPGGAVSEADTEALEGALAAARDRRPDLDEELLGFLGALLAGRVAGEREAAFCRRVQQVTGPVMAKAVEDTLFYRYLPLSSRNEVGGDPGSPPLDPATFHRRAAATQRAHPDGLLANSTHDTKRSEDVRARLAALAELPGEWTGAAERWRDGREDVDPATQWLLFQTAVGAWPIDEERLAAYMEKATREAKLRTSWTDPDPDYDAAVRRLVARCYEDPALQADIEAFAARLARPGWSNSLTQKLLTLAGPGVPDLYQGSELWDLSLVDPDNRRAVDYERRRKILAVTEGAPVAELWAAEAGKGATKLAVVRAALAVRRELPAAFAGGPEGRYQPVAASGAAAEHFLGFLRGGVVLAGGTRLPVALDRRGGWGDTALTLPPGRWVSRLGPEVWEGTAPLASLLAGAPVVLAVRE